MPEIPFISAPADAVAWVWTHLGFTPHECVVLLRLDGQGPHLGAFARVPLRRGRADPLPVDELHEALARALRVLGHEGTYVALVFHPGCDHDDLPGVAAGTAPAPPGPLALRDVVVQLLERTRVEYYDVMGVGTSTYRSLLCTDTCCDASRPRPLADVRLSETALRAAVEGVHVLAREQDLLADVVPGPDDRPLPVPATVPDAARLAELAAEVDAALAAAGALTCDPDPCPAPVTARSGRPVPPAPRIAPDLLAAVQMSTFRDALVAAAASPHRTVGEALQGLSGAEDISTGAPVADRCRAVREVLAAMARQAPPGLAAQPLAAMAWISWYEGHGVRARLLAERALLDDPGNRLAGLQLKAVEAMLKPRWVGAGTAP